MENITTARKIRAFPWLYAGEAANSVFATLSWFGPVLPLFLNALGLSKTRIGLVLAIPYLCAALALLVSRLVLQWGEKRTFLWGYSLRTIATLGLCAAPVVYFRAGAPAAFGWVLAIVLVFSICRMIAETGWLSWSYEMIPSHLRGKTVALSASISGMVTLLATFLAAVFLKQVTGLYSYSLLVLISLPFAVASIFFYGLLPGGRPVPVAAEPRGFYRQVLKDRNFLMFESGNCLFYLATYALVFLPLFLQGPVGLRADQILVLTACCSVGLLASSYLWGWSADRFGSKPVLLTGLLLTSFMPLWMFCLPRQSPWSMTMAIVFYVYFGIVSSGASLAINRYFFVGVLPTDNRNPAYYPVHYSLLNLSAGLGPLLAGVLLDASSGIVLRLSWRRADQFAVLFAVSLILFLAAFSVLRRLRRDGAVPFGEFIAMFVQGNPLIALESMIRYRWAGNEAERLVTTRRLGDARNPMSITELREALSDPSFNVRYEAVLAMARLRAHPELTQALVAVLDSKEPDLCVAAGWALGRLGDQQAIPALRRALASEYALLRARSARSLAALGDSEIVPILLNLLKSEMHNNIRVAYASALGSFGATAALDELLGLLEQLSTENLRGEVALAIARIVGAEQHFIRLWRATRADFGTGLARAIAALRNHAGGRLAPMDIGATAWDALEQTMGAQDLAGGATVLGKLIRQLPFDRLEAALRKVLEECARELTMTGEVRRDYVLLALSALHTALQVLR